MMTKVAAQLAAIGDTASRALATAGTLTIASPVTREVPASLAIAVLTNRQIDAMPAPSTYDPVLATDSERDERADEMPVKYAPHENSTRRKFREHRNAH